MTELRVLHVVTWLRAGGIEKWLLSQIAPMRQLGWQMDFACKGPEVGDLAALAESLGASVHHVPLLASRPLGFVRHLSALLAEGEYGLLNNHLQAHAALGVLSAPASVPVVTSFHNTTFPAQAFGVRRSLARAREIYVDANLRYSIRHSAVVTGCSMAVLSSVTQRAQPRRAGVVYYGVKPGTPAGAEERAAVRAEFGWLPDDHLVLHVGSFMPQKDHGAALDVFRQVLPRIPDARLLLVGDGELTAEVADMAADLIEKGLVAMPGLRSDVRRLMAAADVFLFPSRFEGFGLAALEANAVGLPVVGTNIPGLDEAVVDGETAFLHPPGAIQAMAASVVRLVLDPELRARVASSAIERVNSSFSHARSTERLQEVYRASLGHS